MIARRSIIKGLVALVAAPAIIKVADLMPVNARLQPGNTYLTINDITREAVAMFKQSNRFLALDEYSERILQPMLDQLAERMAQDVLEGEAVLARDFYAGEQWSNEQIGTMLRIRLLKGQARVNAQREMTQVPAPLALAAAAVAVAPALLEKPVTRRFW